MHYCLKTVGDFGANRRVETAGIVECEIIQWFVEPGARVEQFSPLCEVQSDKASSEISSKYDGVVKRLYYEPGEMARVGKPFVDIDTQDVESPAAAASSMLAAEPVPEAPPVQQAELSLPVSESGSSASAPNVPPQPAVKPEIASTSSVVAEAPTAPADGGRQTSVTEGIVDSSTPRNRKRAVLTVPAVRHLSKIHDVDISLISGTGRDGRVLKEDILRYVAEEKEKASSATAFASSSTSSAAFYTPTPASSHVPQQQVETTQALSPTQQYMFRTMTRSLTIPHFLYADEVDFSELALLRARLNKVLAAQAAPPGQQVSQSASAGAGVEGSGQWAVDKLSYLPFIIKAVSLALYRYPILNARVDLTPSSSTSREAAIKANGNGKPSLVYRSLHNIGVAMDTPSGLVVPVIKDVGSRNVLSIASELARLQKAAFRGKLTPADLGGGTITVSNIGNIGGTYVSPVIVEKEVAILGIGRMRTVPAFGEEVDGEETKIVKKQVCNFSWSADHRAIDGATMARAAEVVRKIVEEPDVMVLHLR
ncbi:2-oxoisovalerate dehydrogenase e2 component (dihydrolipoyl transacylase) [Zalerion maritima]|uniref:Dihydrolipoamide acetyltransferase component of pyruvate dehydrogenase complex n=1 Tax=Zalerion maritima TaxID=339359 RepID=A0AAD5WXG0_9PEZI|nr:2-oxoisovalerate dehydrogenase e2 component (dihydrolipoyl transacylase) [Zalerion maritima]